jgi:hypothetical protein
VEDQNEPPLESPSKASEKARFQPGDEWEGNDGGKAVRVQNEPAQDNHGGIMHASKMNACTTKDRNRIRGQNDPAGKTARNRQDNRLNFNTNASFLPLVC